MKLKLITLSLLAVFSSGVMAYGQENEAKENKGQEVVVEKRSEIASKKVEAKEMKHQTKADIQEEAAEEKEAAKKK